MKTLHQLYNSEVELAFDPEATSHRYIADGVPVPGVTSILGVLAKPALIQWAANQAILSVKDNGELSKDETTLKIAVEALEAAKTAHVKTKDKAADVGTLVHDFIQHYPTKQVFPTDPMAKAMCEALVEWYKQNVARDLEVEVPVFSRTYNYAGTPDRVVMTKDRQVVILDWKSGKRVYDEAFIQTGFYSFALREEFRVKPEDAWIVNVTKSKQPMVTIEKLSDRNLPLTHIERAAIQVLSVYQSLKELKEKNGKPI